MLPSHQKQPPTNPTWYEYNVCHKIKCALLVQEVCCKVCPHTLGIRAHGPHTLFCLENGACPKRRAGGSAVYVKKITNRRRRIYVAQNLSLSVSNFSFAYRTQHAQKQMCHCIPEGVRCMPKENVATLKRRKLHGSCPGHRLQLSMHDTVYTQYTQTDYGQNLGTSTKRRTGVQRAYQSSTTIMTARYTRSLATAVFQQCSMPDIRSTNRGTRTSAGSGKAKYHA